MTPGELAVVRAQLETAARASGYELGANWYASKRRMLAGVVLAGELHVYLEVRVDSAAQDIVDEMRGISRRLARLEAEARASAATHP